MILRRKAAYSEVGGVSGSPYGRREIANPEKSRYLLRSAEVCSDCTLNLFKYLKGRLLQPLYNSLEMSAFGWISSDRGSFRAPPAILTLVVGKVGLQDMAFGGNKRMEWSSNLGYLS